MPGITGGSILEPAYTPDMQGGSNSVTSVAAGTTSTALTFSSPSGGKVPYTHTVTTSGGTLSTSNSLNVTLSAMTNGGQYLVTCTSLDAGAGDARQRTIQSKTIIVGEGTPSLEANVKTTLSSGTTSTAISFAVATGGTSPYTYAMVKVDGSAGTLSVDAGGRTGTLSGLIDSDMAVVTCTVTDANGRTATSTKAYGVAIDPSFTFAQWDVVETLRYYEYPVASYTSNQTVEGRAYTVTPNGTPGTCTYSFDADGLNMTTTASTSGDSFVLSVPLNKDNFKNTETFIVEAILKLDGCTSVSGVILMVASTTNINANNQLGMQFDGTGTNVGNIITRKYTASTLTQGASAMTTFAANTWYSVQLIIMQGSILYVSVSQSSSFLGGYSYTTADTIGGGAYTHTLGGVAITTGTVQPGPFRTNMKLNFMTYAGNHKLTVKEVQVLRATRPVQG